MSEPGEPPEVRHGAAPPPPPPSMWTPRPAATAPIPYEPLAVAPAAVAPYAVPPAMTGQPAPPRPSNAGGVTSIFVVMALLLGATVGSYIYVHNKPTSSSSTVQSVSGGQQVGGSNGTRGGAGAPQPGQATTSAPDPYATPTPPPLDMGAVRRTMAAFLNGLQNHDLEAVRSLVCPKFRGLYVGTYSKAGYSYSGWQAHYSSPVPGLNYTYVAVTQGLADATGAKKGSETHSWQVEHDGDEYFVCGYLT